MRRIAVVVFLVFGALPGGARGDGGPALLAGFAARDATPEVGVPLGGFGTKARRLPVPDLLGKYPNATFLKPSVGVHDPIRAKCLVLRSESGKLVFLSLDLVGATDGFREDIARRLGPLGYAKDEIFVSATHTHSGPGTLSHDWLWELAAMDRFRPKVYERFMAEVVATVREADLAAEPAELRGFSFAVEGIQRNRRGVPGHFDRVANTLWVRSLRGPWLGGVVNLAVHGTALGPSNLQFSADVPGSIERALEARLGTESTRPTVLFINGAEGDVAPAESGFDGAGHLGEILAEQVMAGFPGARAIEPRWSLRSTTLRLGRASADLKACGVLKPGALGRHRPRIGMGRMLPRAVELSVLRLGDMALMAWPGEPTTSLGLALREAALRTGAAQAWVMGLTNGHASYFTTPAEFAEGGYEACSSFYGAKAGARIVAEFEALLNSKENP